MRLLRFYGSRNLHIAKGEGQYVWDKDGRKYLDAHTGIGVAFLGHNNKFVTNSIIRQMNKISTVSTSFDTDILYEVSEKLEKVAPKYFTSFIALNSGAEAIEFSIKIARKITRRKKLIAFKNSFHGRTMGALSITWNRKYRDPFEPLIGPVEFLEYNSTEDLNKITEEVAAVIVEPIQGEGGVIPAKKDFMKSLREKCDHTGSLLILDEIQTGFGRTGRTWAHQHFEIQPDIMAAGKAIGGGFPVSVTFIPAWIESQIEEGDHGSTYGSNPLALAAISGAIDAFLNDYVTEKAESKGKELMSKLNKALKQKKEVREIRGQGLMIGIDVRVNPVQVLKTLQDRGLLAVKAGVSTIRFLPSYLINDEDINFMVEVIERAIGGGMDKKELEKINRD